MNLFGLTQRNIKFLLCLGGEVLIFRKFFRWNWTPLYIKVDKKYIYIKILLPFKNCEILQYLTKNIVKIFLEDKNH